MSELYPTEPGVTPEEIEKYIRLALGDTRMSSVLAGEVSRLRVEITTLREEKEKLVARVNELEEIVAAQMFDCGCNAKVLAAESERDQALGRAADAILTEQALDAARAESAALREALERMIEFPVGHPSGPCIAECEDPANCFWVAAKRALSTPSTSLDRWRDSERVVNAARLVRDRDLIPMEHWRKGHEAEGQECPYMALVDALKALDAGREGGAQ